MTHHDLTSRQIEVRDVQIGALADAQSSAVEQREVKEISLIDDRLSWNSGDQSCNIGF